MTGRFAIGLIVGAWAYPLSRILARVLHHRPIV